MVDVLLRLSCPETSRREGLNSLHRLADQGWINLDGKRHLCEVAGAMVWLVGRSVPRHPAGKTSASIPQCRPPGRLVAIAAQHQGGEPMTRAVSLTVAAILLGGLSLAISLPAWASCAGCG